MEQVICPKCGSKEIVEISDGLWEKRYFEFDKDLKQYQQIDMKSDGAGETYLECENGHNLKEFEDKFFQQVNYA